MSGPKTVVITLVVTAVLLALILLIRHAAFIGKDNAQITCDIRGGEWVDYEWANDRCEYPPDVKLNLRSE